jgi:AcrR family transcriptional regulator
VSHDSVVVVTSTKSRRSYHQRARAAHAAANTQRIIDATQGLASTLPLSEVTLEAVARESGTSVQSILRRFGSRDSLLAGAFAAADADIEARLARASANEPSEAIRLLAREYERWGDALMHLLGQEGAEPLLAPPLHRGRKEHRAWVRRVFAAVLASRQPRNRRRLLAQLVVSTDVTAWHGLRRNGRLAARETEQAMVEIANGLTRG